MARRCVAPAARSRSRTARIAREAGRRPRLDDDERAGRQRQRALDRLPGALPPSARRRRRTARRRRRPAHRPRPGRPSGAATSSPGRRPRPRSSGLPQPDAEAEQLRIAIEERDAADRRPARQRRPQHRAGPGAEIGDGLRLDPRVTLDSVEHRVERGGRRRQPHDGVGEALGVGEPADRTGRGGAVAVAPRQRVDGALQVDAGDASPSRQRWRPAARDRTARPRQSPTSAAAGRSRAPTSSTRRRGGPGRAPADRATRWPRRRRWRAAPRPRQSARRR